MISLYYAKKIGNKYVLNFYADKQEDLAAFDAAKEFMFYGVPAAGSTITVTTGSDGVNYYLNKEGTFVKIETGGDEPVPGEFIAFEVKKSYSGIDFGNVVLGETSATMDEFLAGLDYEDDQCMLLAGDLSDGTDYFLAAVYAEEVHALLVGGEGDSVIFYSDKDDIDFGNKGWKNLTDGKFIFPFSYTVNEDGINDTTPPTWNGVLFGAIEGEAGLQPIRDGQTLAGLIIDPTALTFEQIDNFINSFSEQAFLVSGETQDSIGTILLDPSQGIIAYISDENHPEENSVAIVAYAKEDGTFEGAQVTRGWNEIRMEMVEEEITYVATPLTERKQYTFGGTGGAPIDQVNESFDTLNGVVFGGIEGEPTPVVLTSFSDGQNIVGFQLDPNAIPEGYSTMAEYVEKFDKSTTLLGLKGAGGVYVDLSKDLPVIQIVPESDLYMATYISSEEAAQSIGLHAGWILMDSTGDTPIYSQITEVTDLIPSGFSHTIDTKDDIISDTAGWNGVFVGAIIGSTSYTITANITDGSYTGDASIFENGKASGVITPTEGYAAPDVNSVVVEGASAAVTYDNNQTLISLSNPIGNVTITATCTK